MSTEITNTNDETAGKTPLVEKADRGRDEARDALLILEELARAFPEPDEGEGASR